MPFGAHMPGDSDTNLLSILINIAFGFVAGLMFFFGVVEVIAYGSKLATQLIKVSGYGQQMAQFGFASAAAPYIVLAPIGGMVLKQLSAVRSIKGFLYFVVTLAIGAGASFLAQGYFKTLI